MARKIITGEKLMIAKMKFKDGFLVPLHHHVHEQVTQVVSGQMRFWFGEDKEYINGSVSGRRGGDPIKPAA